jgi:amicyanin
VHRFLFSGRPASAGPPGPHFSPLSIVLRGAGPLLFSFTVLVVLSGCTGEDSNDDVSIDPVSTATTHDVAIELFQYQPPVIEIEAGDSVTWSNSDAIEHSATFASNELDIDTGLFQQDESITLTFPESGTYDYFCTRHPTMTGSVIVLEAEG